jgi:hypothetical protein
MTFLLIVLLVVLNITLWTWYVNMIEDAKQLNIPYSFSSVVSLVMGIAASALSVYELIHLLD